VNLTEAMGSLLEARQEWDEAPALYYVLGEPDDCQLRELRMITALWGTLDGHPASIIEKLTELARARELDGPRVPEGLTGIALRCEGWTVGLTGDDAVGRMEMEAAASRRELHKHPGRQEMRFTIAILKDGSIHGAMMLRSGGGATEAPAGEATGRVTEALTLLLMEMLQMKTYPVEDDSEESERLTRLTAEVGNLIPLLPSWHSGDQAVIYIGTENAGALSGCGYADPSEILPYLIAMVRTMAEATGHPVVIMEKKAEAN
jgi:hypothetical protein